MRLLRGMLTIAMVWSLAGCAGDPRTPPEGDPVPATDPALSTAAPPAITPPTSDRTWRSLAAHAEGGAADAERRLETLEPGGRALIEDTLARMAASGLGADALRAAGSLAELEAGRANDPRWAGSGTPPGTATMRAAGIALLEGMAFESAQAAPESGESLAEAACDMSLPPVFNSGGRVDDAPARRRLLDAIDRGLPPDVPRRRRCPP